MKSSLTTLLSVFALLTLIGAPVVAHATSGAQNTVSWTDVATEDNYEVYRSDDGAAAVLITTLGADVTSFLDDGGGAGLALGVQYCYHITATNGFGAAPDSAQACVTPSVADQVIGVQVISEPHP